jgi:hypothetical protein
VQVTDALLIDRLDANLAVDQALSPFERAAFQRHLLVGAYDGAEPADWLAETIERDAELAIVEPWMAEHGERFIAVLRERNSLPVPVATQILLVALHAKIALSNFIEGTDQRRMAVEIAHDAMLWARGYAFGIGWTADQSSWPAHLRDEAPRQRCSSCQRYTWSTEEFGQTCGMPQPSGERCPGTFGPADSESQAEV